MDNGAKILIVTGLPRSGTSMCMKMLEAGGYPLLTDGLRKADKDNPNGYYEYEPVKATQHDDSWLSQARGKAVKMVYRLLYDLPLNRRYDVLFMRRDLDEVLASQEVMLARQGRAETANRQAEFKVLYERELRQFTNWIRTRPNFRVLEVDYNLLLRDPAPKVSGINDFLGGRLDEEAMARVVDRSLYRNRTSDSDGVASTATTG